MLYWGNKFKHSHIPQSQFTCCLEQTRCRQHWKKRKKHQCENVPAKTHSTSHRVTYLKSKRFPCLNNTNKNTIVNTEYNSLGFSVLNISESMWNKHWGQSCVWRPFLQKKRRDPQTPIRYDNSPHPAQDSRRKNHIIVFLVVRALVYSHSVALRPKWSMVSEDPVFGELWDWWCPGTGTCIYCVSARPAEQRPHLKQPARCFAMVHGSLRCFPAWQHPFVTSSSLKEFRFSLGCRQTGESCLEECPPSFQSMWLCDYFLLAQFAILKI